MTAAKRYGRGIRILVAGEPYILYRLAKILNMSSQELRRNWEALGRPIAVKSIEVLTTPRARKPKNNIPITVVGAGRYPSMNSVATTFGITRSTLQKLVRENGPTLTQEQLGLDVVVEYTSPPKKVGKRKRPRAELYGSSEWKSLSIKDRSDRLALIP